MTKNLTKDEMELIVGRLGTAFEEGRNDVAPELSCMDVQPMMRLILQLRGIWFVQSACVFECVSVRAAVSVDPCLSLSL